MFVLNLSYNNYSFIHLQASFCIFYLFRITEDRSAQIFPLVHEYQIERLLEICEAVLMKEASVSDVGNLHFLFIAEQFGLKKLHEICENKAKTTKISQLTNQKHYKEISRDTLVLILEHHSKRMENGPTTSRIWNGVPRCQCR